MGGLRSSQGEDEEGVDATTYAPGTAEGDDPSSPFLGSGLCSRRHQGGGLRWLGGSHQLPLTLEPFVMATIVICDISSSQDVRRRVLHRVEGDPDFGRRL
jgi:hypothetical protein